MCSNASLRGILAAPVGQARADRLGVLKAGNVVAAEAAVLGDRLAADVLQPLVSQSVGGLLAGSTIRSFSAPLSSPSISGGMPLHEDSLLGGVLDRTLRSGTRASGP